MSTQPARITPMKQVKPSEKADISGQKRPKLTPKQEEFAEAYLLTHYICDAAEQIEISDRQARRWLTLPHVQQAIEDLRQERRDAIRDKIEQCLDFATELMHKTLHNAIYPEHSRDTDQEIKFVPLLFKYAHDQREIDALRLRVAQLEADAKNVVDGTVERESDTNPTL